MAVETFALSPELRGVAERLFWWKPPEEAVADPRRFAAQVMTLGNWNDVRTTRRALGDAALREALRTPPPGVFDERSWVYWHHVFGIAPVPPRPLRNLR